MDDQQYAALVPVKPPARGKSRLVGADDATRRALAAAFARDTVLACLAADRVAQVLVVTDDVRVRRTSSAPSGARRSRTGSPAT